MGIATKGWVLVIFLAVTARAGAQVNASQELDKGDQARKDGKWQEAIAAYKTAYGVNDQKVQAEAAFKAAQVVRSWMDQDPQKADMLPVAVEWYQMAIEKSTGKDRALAANNLGVLYTQKGRFNDAVDTFRNRVFTGLTLDAKDVFVYEFNFARALEQQKTPQSRKEALDLYWRALKQQPRFQPAAEAIGGMLLQDNAKPPRDAELLVRFLISRQQTREAGQQLLRFLKAWAGGADADLLLPALLGYYEAAAQRPQDEEQVRTQILAALPTQERLRALIQELQQVYQTNKLLRPEQPLYVDAAEVREQFSAWKDPLFRTRIAAAFSRLLKRVAAYYHQENTVPPRPKAEGGKAPDALPRGVLVREAAARYSAAFQLDETNFEALLGTATMLADPAGNIPADNRKQFVDKVFDVKMQLRERAHTPQDWKNLYYLHRVLADFYARDKRFGPRDDPHTVVFQLEEAKKDEIQIADKDRTYPLSPDVHANLGRAYRALGDKSESEKNYARAAVMYRDRASQGEQRGDRAYAVTNYSRAADAFHSANRIDQARELQNKVNKLKSSPDLGGRPEPAPPRKPIRLPDKTATPPPWAEVRHPSEIAIVAFVPRTNHVLFAADKQLFLWDLDSRKSHALPIKADNVITCLAIVSDGKAVAVGENGGVRLHDLASGREIVFLRERGQRRSPILALAADRVASLLGAAARDGTTLWDLRERRLVHELLAPQGASSALAISTQNDRLALADGQSVQVWDISLRKHERTLTGHAGKINALVFDSSGGRIATASEDRTVRVWDIRTGSDLKRFQLSSPIKAVSFLPDSPLLAAAAADGTVVLLDTQSGKQHERFSVKTADIRSLGFSSDGRLLAVGTGHARAEGKIVVWQIKK